MELSTDNVAYLRTITTVATGTTVTSSLAGTSTTSVQTDRFSNGTSISREGPPLLQQVSAQGLQSATVDGSQSTSSTSQFYRDWKSQQPPCVRSYLDAARRPAPGCQTEVTSTTGSGRLTQSSSAVRSPVQRDPHSRLASGDNHISALSIQQMPPSHSPPRGVTPTQGSNTVLQTPVYTSTEGTSVRSMPSQPSPPRGFVRTQGSIASLPTFVSTLTNANSAFQTTARVGQVPTSSRSLTPTPHQSMMPSMTTAFVHQSTEAFQQPFSGVTHPIPEAHREHQFLDPAIVSCGPTVPNLPQFRDHQMPYEMMHRIIDQSAQATQPPPSDQITQPVFSQPASFI